MNDEFFKSFFSGNLDKLCLLLHCFDLTETDK